MSLIQLGTNINSWQQIDHYHYQYYISRYYTINTPDPRLNVVGWQLTIHTTEAQSVEPVGCWREKENLIGWSQCLKYKWGSLVSGGFCSLWLQFPAERAEHSYVVPSSPPLPLPAVLLLLFSILAVPPGFPTSPLFHFLLAHFLPSSPPLVISPPICHSRWWTSRWMPCCFCNLMAGLTSGCERPRSMSTSLNHHITSHLSCTKLNNEPLCLQC